jgi:antitoxin component YwqK of YwqJK toxin-antitoxin module
MVRVDSDEIYVDYEGRDQYWMWQGKRFTGISVEVGVDGHTVSETTYVDGLETGPHRTWYWNGKLESEGVSRWNRNHGPFKTWYESGRLQYEGFAESGYVIWRREWDEEGNLVSEYKIEDNPEKLSWLETTRNWDKSHSIS